MTRLFQSCYDELAAIVGRRNITDDPAFLGSHDWFGLGAAPTPDTLIGKPPGAVVMPGSTEEVAAVVKACNRHGVGFKAHSTGHGNFCGVGTAGSVSIDLRRMNRLEIDAKNRMAIIEPYVTAGQLMAEAFKHHLICHVVGAGPLHSPLASATAYMGVGVPGNHTSNNARNLLSLEWVTPEGEIVRIGSAGSDAGWFTGEGPGPGFRGMLRGIIGTAGSLGVFTRIGYKLYPWAGEDHLEWTGVHPDRGVRLPANFSYHQVEWPDWKAMTEGTYQLKNARIATMLTRTPPVAVGMMITPTNRAYHDAYTTGNLPPIAVNEGTGWTVILMGWTPEELAWKRQALQAVLADTGGRDAILAEQHRDILAANLVTSLYVARFLRMGGAAAVTNGVMDSIGLIPRMMERSTELIGDGLQPGRHMLVGETEQNWMWLSEGRHLWSENNPPGTCKDPKSMGAFIYVMLSSFYRNEKQPIGFAAFVSGSPMVDLFGPHYSNVQKWMRRIKLTFDPRNLSDSKHYITPEVPGLAKVWPYTKRILFAPWFAPIFRRLLAKTK